MNCTHENGWRRPFDVIGDRAVLAVFTRTSPQCDPNFSAPVFKSSHQCLGGKTGA